MRWPSCRGSRRNGSTIAASHRRSTATLTPPAYAYDYLFDQDPVLAEGRGPSDPRFRLAMEIYNAGVDRLIRAAQTKGQIQPQNGEAIPFKVHGREQSLRIASAKTRPWSAADIHKLLLAVGLRGQRHQPGPLPVWTGRSR